MSQRIPWPEMINWSMHQFKTLTMNIINAPKSYNVRPEHITCYKNVLHAFENPQDVTEQIFPYFDKPFPLRTRDDKAAWFMTELARVQPPQTPIQVKLLQFVHCRLIYQMKGAKRQLPTAVHVAFSLSPLKRPERVVLSTSLDLLSVFGSSIVGVVKKYPQSKTVEQLQNYNEIGHYFPSFQIPVGPKDSLDDSMTKFGNCCEDKPWKALAGHAKGSKPVVDPATVYGWSVNARKLLTATGFDVKAHDEYRMALCRNCEYWIRATGGDLTHFDTKEKNMVEPWNT
ncbi:MAG: hypothetical protein Q9168_008289 [Polycauliona sp. 1 TL-2023]